MSYYSKSYHDDDASWFTIILCFVLIVALVLGFNSCTATAWNDGVCTNCEVRYELRGVSRGLKYYACPECGQEVQRY